MAVAWTKPLPPQAEERMSRGVALLVLILTALGAAFVLWANHSSLAIVSVAVGEVKPSSRVKQIQHLEGGIVEEILVREGQTVSEGQPLMSLSTTRDEADLAELNARLRTRRVDRIRLIAEIQGADTLDIPAELEAEAPQLTASARDMFETRKQQAAAETGRLSERVQQRRQEIRTIETHYASARQSLALVDEQFKISEELLAKGITNRYSHLELQREVQRIKGEIAHDREAIKGAKAALAAAESELQEARLIRLEAARTELAAVETELSELGERLRKFEDTLDRTTIRAPVSGIIKEMAVATVGGVVQSGETVFTIVPEGDTLIVEARLPPHEAGYVRPGQRAVIRLNSAELARFGHIEGEVQEISPDRLTTENGEPYFRVRISAQRSYFEADDARYDLFPGTQVIANIQTGERTVMDYITAPLVSEGRRALLER
ncbi:HlyD family type I secretion periplasmic adaptor subunit [Hwanghaeella sp.]|uniref:HlyD family type I secretion periplasmic adaptor subunit n=1 Tax=Hwanghaeella sp. TaxID=2605943 RepID=UPI003CCBAB10